MADIIYTYGDKVYMNITNKCPCKCTFCIRSNGDGLGSAKTLWHEKDPSIDEIKAAIDNFDFTPYNEITFCGYGEPLCALDNLIEACKYLRERYNIKIRINTNGLGDLINKKDTAKILGEYIDTVSISLNAPNKERYMEITRPAFGENSFDAMLDFSRECKKYVKSVKLSLVDVIPKSEIEQCKKLAGELGIVLRVREYTK